VLLLEVTNKVGAQTTIA